jgi:hypothetical protein
MSKHRHKGQKELQPGKKKDKNLGAAAASERTC